MPGTGPPARLIALVGFDGAQSLDLVGPTEVFTAANRHRRPRDPAYQVVLASPRGGDIVSGSGLRFGGATPIAALPEAIDTLIVAGGNESALRAAAPALLPWLKRRAGSTRRMASVCTGAFLLAAADLLDGRRATTHWYSCSSLQAMCPGTRVDPDAIFVADPPIYTSAGVTAGIDLCLAFVEADCGSAAAVAAARDLVVFMRRPGGQSQFSTALKAQAAATPRLSRLAAEIAEDPSGDLRVPNLAERAGMSERSFVRAFRREAGITPARFVQQARIERAKALLEASTWPLARIAERSGFGSLHSLHRAFLQLVGVTPTAYRMRFGKKRNTDPKPESPPEGPVG